MSTLAFYHKCIRKTTASFASLFNNIILIRDDGQRIMVPVDYADGEKYVKRLEGDPELNKKVQVVLPRIAYEFNGFRYDKDRKLNTNNKNYAPSSNTDKIFYQYNPVPYDFDFTVTVYTRTVEDGNQIIEQIIPYFTPDFTLKVFLVPDMGISRNLPVLLNYAEPFINSTGPFNSELRSVYWTLKFTVKGYIFGAIKEGPIIKTANTNFSTDASVFGDGKGVCCTGNQTKSFIVQSGGYGNYINNEVVYQGRNLETAYASGIVSDWIPSANTLVISEICGEFKFNQPVIGTDSLAIHIPVSNSSNTTTALKISVAVNPLSANANSYWSTNTTVQTYPNIN